MAANPIVIALGKVPWKEVVKAAPALLDAAVKLWKTVGQRKSLLPAPPQPIHQDTAPPIESQVTQVRDDLARVVSTVGQLQEQMQATSVLIMDLAEQNTRLIARVELHRQRVVLLAVAVTVAFVALAVSFGIFMLQR